MRAYTREPACSGLTPEQTHDDCEWLDEEDGEEDVPGDRRYRDRRRRSPAITEDKCWNARRQHDARSEYGEREGRHERWR